MSGVACRLLSMAVVCGPQVENHCNRDRRDLLRAGNFGLPQIRSMPFNIPSNHVNNDSKTSQSTCVAKCVCISPRMNGCKRARVFPWSWASVCHADLHKYILESIFTSTPERTSGALKGINLCNIEVLNTAVNNSMQHRTDKSITSMTECNDCHVIHSFIQAISIAPLQVHYYSEALLTNKYYLYTCQVAVKCIFW